LARKSPLTRERVLRAALDLADRDGLDALSMRALGAAMGVQAMSLYNHVADKDAVLDGIVDLVVAEIAVPSASQPWRAAMHARAVSSHTVLLRHPWAPGLLVSTKQIRLIRLLSRAARAGVLS